MGEAAVRSSFRGFRVGAGLATAALVTALVLSLDPSLAAAQDTTEPNDFSLVEQRTILGDANELSGVINVDQGLIGVDDDGQFLCISRDDAGNWTSAQQRAGTVTQTALDGYDFEAISYIPEPSSGFPLVVAWEKTDAQNNQQSGLGKIRIVEERLTLEAIGTVVDVPSITGSQGIQGIAAVDQDTAWVGRQTGAVSLVNLSTGAVIGSPVALEGILELEGLTLRPGDDDHVWALGRTGAGWVVRKHLLSTGAKVGADLAVGLPKPGGLSFASARQANDATTLIVVGEPAEVAVYGLNGGAIDNFFFSEPCRAGLDPTFVATDADIQSAAEFVNYRIESTQDGCTNALEAFEFQSGPVGGPVPVAVHAFDGTICVYEILADSSLRADDDQLWVMPKVLVSADQLQAVGDAASPVFQWQPSSDYTGETLLACVDWQGNLVQVDVLGFAEGASFTNATLTVNGQPTSTLGSGDLDVEVFDALDGWVFTSGWNLEQDWTSLISSSPTPEWSGIAIQGDDRIIVDDNGIVTKIKMAPSQIDVIEFNENAQFAERQIDLEGVTRVGSKQLFVTSWERIVPGNPAGAQTNNSGLTFFRFDVNGDLQSQAEYVTNITGAYPGNVNHGLEGITWARSDADAEVFYAVKQHATGDPNSSPILYEISVPFSGDFPVVGAPLDITQVGTLPLTDAAGIIMSPDVADEVWVISAETLTITSHNASTGAQTGTILTLPAIGPAKSAEGLAFDDLRGDALWIVGEQQVLRKYVRGNDELSVGDRVVLEGETSDGPVDLTTLITECSNVAVASFPALTSPAPSADSGPSGSGALRIAMFSVALAAAGVLIERGGRKIRPTRRR